MKERKAAGFYVGLAAILLSAAAAALYAVKISSFQYKESLYDSRICLILAISAGLSVIMFFIRRTEGFAPVLICAGSGIALLMYIRKIIWPVADTIYGIEPFPHIKELLLCAGLLFAAFVFAEFSLYLKKSKVKHIKEDPEV